MISGGAWKSEKSVEGRLTRFQRSSLWLDRLKILLLFAAGAGAVWQYFESQRQREDLAREQAQLEIVRTKLQSQQIDLEIAQLRAGQATDAPGAFALTASFAESKRMGKWRVMDLEYKYENKGKVPLVIGAVVIEWYVGKLDHGLRASPILRTNLPPSHALDAFRRAGASSEANPIRWSRVLYRACSNLAVPTDGLISGYSFESGGCGIDTYAPSLETANKENFLFYPRRDVEFVGASIFVLYSPTGTEFYRHTGLSQPARR